MSPEETVVFGIRLAIITVGVLAGTVYLLQRHLSAVYGVSSLMFLAFVVSQLIYVAETLAPGLDAMAHHAVHMLSYVAAFLLLPTFFFHLLMLSNASVAITRRQLAVHLSLPALVLFLAMVSMLIASEVLVALKSGQPAPGAAPWMELTVQVLLALEFGGYTFVLVYIWLLFRWQSHNRTRLNTLYASPSRYEALWTFGLAAIMALFVVQALTSYFLRDGGLGHPLGPIQQSIIVLLFVSLVAIRDLRQAPGLYAASELTCDATPKYSKSALADVQAQRIAKKLRSAMQDDRLYRDANLSLAKLAQHIGSSPNYVSQTLNEHMDQSFFDFVNYWRIQEAEGLLIRSDETILAVAYEVGFNSRSAFYTAFKKHIGETPSQYRAARSTAIEPKGTPALREEARP
ncbi:MAG: helix-turn-helix transcriptional regulator [Pseudomonadota bacterium]